MITLVIKKIILYGKTNHTSVNSITPAAKVGATEASVVQIIHRGFSILHSPRRSFRFQNTRIAQNKNLT